MICATCGKSNADHLVFCEDCGGRLAPRVVPPTPPIGVPMQPMQPAATAPEGPKCPRCGAANAPGMRFCITCGSPLERLSQPAIPPVVPSASPIAATALAPAIPSAPVAPAQPIAASQICKRCQGASDKGAQFCRFCGAPLGDPPAGTNPTKSTLPSAQSPNQPVQSSPAPEVRRLDSTIVTGAPIMAEIPKAEPASGRIVVIKKDGSEGASYPLAEQLDIGRSEGDAQFADDRYMGPRHMRLTLQRDGGRLTVRDLGTPNGVFLRLRKDKASPVEDQDLILLGQQVLRFEIVKEAEAGLGAASEHGTLLFGTPAGQRYARLSQRTTEGVTCDVFHLRKAETVLGRESGDIVFPDDQFLSRRHAALHTQGENPRKFMLSDLGSSNGTFLRIRGEVDLQHGDEVRVGQQLLRIELRRPS